MMEFLPTLWFILIAVLWIGFLFLEGFDLGVGMLIKLLTRSHRERRVLLNTIGPVWDGNEVWLITALGAMFATFPLWYAALLSALYIPMVFVLLGLIFRAVAIEYRGKVASEKWQRCWDWALSLGSATAAFGVGVALAATTTGLPVDGNGDRVGGPFAWFNGYTLLGGLAVVLLCLMQGTVFLALKTDGPIRHRARTLFSRVAFVAVLPALMWAVLVQLHSGKNYVWLLILLATAGFAAGVRAAKAGREGWGFVGAGFFLVAIAASLFINVYPTVLRSALNEQFNLTLDNAASSPYTLAFTSVVAAFGVPVVLAYQAWSYWVFRKRIATHHIPAPP